MARMGAGGRGGLSSAASACVLGWVTSPTVTPVAGWTPGSQDPFWFHISYCFFIFFFKKNFQHLKIEV